MIRREVYVRKIPSMGILDTARVVAPEKENEIVGIRPGEKLHEQMIGAEDAPSTYEYDKYYKIIPAIDSGSNAAARVKGGTKVASDFLYASDTNPEWMNPEDLSRWIDGNRSKIGAI